MFVCGLSGQATDATIGRSRECPRSLAAYDRRRADYAAIDYHNVRSATHHSLDVDELSASGGWNQALRLAVRGHLGEQFPFALTAEGGPLRPLQEASGPWPFTLDFEFPESSGLRLHASGALDMSKGEARFDFGAGAGAGRCPH